MSAHFTLMSEKDFSQQVKGVAEALGWLVYRTWNSKNSPAGFPDLTLVRDGKVIFSELKRMDGKVSEHQEKWLGRLRECAGVETYLWRPSDIDEIEKILR